MFYEATKLYGDGLVTVGQAAKMSGLIKKTFIEILDKYGVSLFSESEDDLLNDIKNAWGNNYLWYMLLAILTKQMHSLLSQNNEVIFLNKLSP